MLVEAPLLSRVTAGKAKKEGAIEETHRKGGVRCRVEAEVDEQAGVDEEGSELSHEVGLC